MYHAGRKLLGLVNNVIINSNKVLATYVLTTTLTTVLSWGNGTYACEPSK